MAKLTPADRERRKRIAEAGSFVALLDTPQGRKDLEAEARCPDGLIDEPMLDELKVLRAKLDASRRSFGLLSLKDVLFVPGFMGSTLKDRSGGNGLIWIDPRLFIGQGGAQLGALELKAFAEGTPETDKTPNVRVEATGGVIVYEPLMLRLEFARCHYETFPVDWRKDLERIAQSLADTIRQRMGQSPRPLVLMAHSQGALVARRAVQMLGAADARRLIEQMILVAPANFGTFSAAFAIAGSHEMIASLEELGVKLPANINQVLQSFTGLYQLLPWKPGSVDPGFDLNQLGDKAFWKTGCDTKRLDYGHAWSQLTNTDFFNDRTAVILGDRPTTTAVAFQAGKLVETKSGFGDGTVPDGCAILPGVRTYRAKSAEHMKIVLNRSALAAIVALIHGREPRVLSSGVLSIAGKDSKGVPTLAEPPKPEKGNKLPPVRQKQFIAPEKTPPPPEAPKLHRVDPPRPASRRVQVFSFDPLLAAKLETLSIARITIDVQWEEPGRALAEGPIGEYVEVVDYDPASRCFYPPVNLNQPRLMAQNGLVPNESDPQFHQQMVYAVTMATIRTFEQALGRTALWRPNLRRDANGKVIPGDVDRYVQRLRLYPHALRAANAYYDPNKHAILFGYFPSNEDATGDTLPQGTVFTCLSYDIVAHETTHALLHGLHRYFLEASNPDVLAFHEAFADAVALFQHFSHPEVLRDQIARTRGDLKSGSLLGNLARQFGKAMGGGKREALREYLTRTPDPTLLDRTPEPHDRGAILMAALFRAFLNIYGERIKDLIRIASNGSGELPPGAISQDLARRLADEAAKSARHLLGMAVRALDYIPPVDLTFGEYLRALITADYDLVLDDDRGYRVAVIEAFRAWGIYPADLNVLDEAAVRWRPPPPASIPQLREILAKFSPTQWTLRSDRRAAFESMRALCRECHTWIEKYFDKFDGNFGESLGLVLGGPDLLSIPKSAKGNLRRFEVHSVRPCTRIGPDGQQRTDVVAEVVQRRAGYFDEVMQKAVDDGKKPLDVDNVDFWFRGGCTMLIDPESGQIRYCIRKSIRNDARLARQRDFEGEARGGLAATYFAPDPRSPFALLHADD